MSCTNYYGPLFTINEDEDHRSDSVFTIDKDEDHRSDSNTDAISESNFIKLMEDSKAIQDQIATMKQEFTINKVDNKDKE